MLYEVGKPIGEIAREVGTSRKGAKSILVKTNAERKKEIETLQVKRATEREAELIAKMYKEGKSIPEIARELKRSVHTVYTHLKELGIERRKRRLTKEEIETIVKMHREGKPVSEIARELKRSTSAVYSHLKRLGVESEKKKKERKLTEEEIEAIVKMYKGGKSIYEIAREIRRSPYAVYSHLKKMGVNTRRKRKLLTEEEIEVIAKMYREGKKVMEIAEEVERSYYAVYTQLKKMGLK